MTTLPNFVIRLTAPSQARVRARVNVRESPSTAAARVGRLEPGTLLRLDAAAIGSVFLDSDTWFRIEPPHGGWVWAGALNVEEAAEPAASATAAAAALQVNRRSNGTILPLTTAELDRLFGPLNPTDAGGGRAHITTPGWEANNLEPFEHVALDHLDIRPPRFHVKARPHLKRAFDAIHGAGLSHLILTWDGSFVPRYKNWDASSRQLSSHSWGIAFDVNQRFNGVRQVPALAGKPGDLRPLVPLLAEQGFAWGGHFSSPLDGMHFELARLDP